MNSTNPVSTFCTGIAMLVIGLLMTIWGISILVKPNLLNRNGLVYRWWSMRTGLWPRQKRPADSRQLSDPQIRFWASVTTFAGIFMTVAAVYGFLAMWDLVGSLPGQIPK